MKRITFKKYAGVRIRGKEPIPLPRSGKHLDRAVWLTAQVESGGSFGCVMNYDGTGMTASIGQAIAVYPRGLADDIKANDQGPLWKVLHRIEMSGIVNAPFIRLEQALKDVGWAISNDGKCRWIETGGLVPGRNIRREFTGDFDGIMPVRGNDRARAQRWVMLFHDLFAHPATFNIQLALEKEHFVKRASRVKLHYCRDEFWAGRTVQSAIYRSTHIDQVSAKVLGMEMDLAMAMYWSNSVNAPSFALKRFCRQVVDKKLTADEPGPEVAKWIIRKMGNTPFARWDDDIKNGRYQRTRRYAMKLWPRHLFVGPEAIMPGDLPG